MDQKAITLIVDLFGNGCYNLSSSEHQMVFEKQAYDKENDYV